MSTFKRRCLRDPYTHADSVALAHVQHEAATAVAEAIKKAIALLKGRDLAELWDPDKEEIASEYEAISALIGSLFEAQAHLLRDWETNSETVETLALRDWELRNTRNGIERAEESMFSRLNREMLF